MNWISDHSNALNFITNLGMLFIWIVYLQLFLITYLRSRKPRIIINRSYGSDVDAICIVSNMSQEPIYTQNIYCTIHHQNGTCAAAITDREILQESGRDQRPDGVTSQGPLNQGDFVSMGTFKNMLAITSERSEEFPDGIDGLADKINKMEIMVISAFGGDDLEIAATREFRIDTSVTPWKVIPMGPATKQISSRKERKKIRKMVIDNLNND